jgi:glutamyl-tRNA reductase
LGGNALRFEDMSDYLVSMDIVLVSTGAKHHILTKKLISEVMKKRSYEPMFIIDISVPRNVEPPVGELEEVFLYDIDDLKQVVENNLKDRQREAQKGEIILWDEVDKFMRWLDSLRVEPIILKIKESAKEFERNNPYLRRVLFKTFREIKRNPEIAPLMLKIFSEEVKDNVHRGKELSYVYNRTDGA